LRYFVNIAQVTNGVGHHNSIMLLCMDGIGVGYVVIRYLFVGTQEKKYRKYNQFSLNIYISIFHTKSNY